MADTLDCNDEATGCFRLAAGEANPEVKTVLESLARSWLLLADQMRRHDAPHDHLGGDAA